MCKHGPQTPHRVGRLRGLGVHDGTIMKGRSNEMWTTGVSSASASRLQVRRSVRCRAIHPHPQGKPAVDADLHHRGRTPTGAPPIQKDRYNREWILGRHSYPAPRNSARCPDGVIKSTLVSTDLGALQAHNNRRRLVLHTNLCMVCGSDKLPRPW